jgi:hypothetical protein
MSVQYQKAEQTVENYMNAVRDKQMVVDGYQLQDANSFLIGYLKGTLVDILSRHASKAKSNEIMEEMERTIKSKLEDIRNA